MQTQSVPKPSDRWIPWYFAAFFVALTAVLVPMCIIAVHTGSGSVTDNAYEKGLAYNKAIRAAEEQNTLNWRGALTVTPIDGRLFVQFNLANATGKPLNGAEVKFWLVRPTQAGKDQSVVLASQNNGRYTGEVTLPVHGSWEARVSATVDGHNYQTVKRMVLP
jgi:nitrogen fixation protein FixH